MLIALGGLPGTGKTTIRVNWHASSALFICESIRSSKRSEIMVWRAAPWTMRGIGRHTQSLLIIYAPVKR